MMSTESTTVADVEAIAPMEGDVSEVTNGTGDAENVEPDSSAEIAELREQVRRLTEELETRKAQQEKAAAQIDEFSALFPDIAVNTVPEEVWDSVRSGNSLAAAYALYTRRVEARDEQVKAVNAKNAAHSTGKAGRGTAEEYFTPAEVKAMSRSEVRANYSKIIESMKKWN